jgi:hypothetical protein
VSGVLGAGGMVPSNGVARLGTFEGVSSGGGGAGVDVLFCNRSLGAFLSFGCFFFFLEVSPFNPSGAAWVFSAAFSSALIATGVAATFSFTFFNFAVFFSALTCFARAL